jgi:hypothetical protein
MCIQNGTPSNTTAKSVTTMATPQVPVKLLQRQQQHPSPSPIFFVYCLIQIYYLTVVTNGMFF